MNYSCSPELDLEDCALSLFFSHDVSHYIEVKLDGSGSRHKHNKHGCQITIRSPLTGLDDCCCAEDVLILTPLRVAWNPGTPQTRYRPMSVIACRRVDCTHFHFHISNHRFLLLKKYLRHSYLALLWNHMMCTFPRTSRGISLLLPYYARRPFMFVTVYATSAEYRRRFVLRFTLTYPGKLTKRARKSLVTKLVIMS